MKCIDAIIKPHQLDQVKERLTAVGVQGLTVTEVRGFGRQKGHTELYRGAEYVVDFLPKVRLTVLATENQVAAIVQFMVANPSVRVTLTGYSDISPGRCRCWRPGRSRLGTRRRSSGTPPRPP